jgi:hypothetical protein
MVENTPEALILYNREERTFLFHKRLYSIRTIDGIYLISNEQGVDRFYFKVESPFMNYPEQVSIYTRNCSLQPVVFYMWRLNRIFLEDIPERWLEIWIIALFKNLCKYFGEEYLITSSVLDKNCQFHLPSYMSLLRMYKSFEEKYPYSFMVNIPYTRSSFEIDFLLTMIYEDGFQKYFERVHNADIQTHLVTSELQLAYAEIFSESNSTFLHYNLKAMEGVNDAVLTQKIFVVFKGSIPIFAFCCEYEKLLLTV